MPCVVEYASEGNDILNVGGRHLKVITYVGGY